MDFKKGDKIMYDPALLSKSSLHLYDTDEPKSKGEEWIKNTKIVAFEPYVYKRQFSPIHGDIWIDLTESLNKEDGGYSSFPKDIFVPYVEINPINLKEINELISQFDNL